MDTVGGFVLRAIVGLLGVRVTSWHRTKEENANTPGADPNSAHLQYAAIDYASETPKWKTDVIMRFAKGGKTTRGTAPHYHVEPQGWLGPVAIATTALLVARRR